MKNSERLRLLFGLYPTPAFKYGDVVMCDVRGEVTIVGMTNAKIPWPIGKTYRARSLVIYGPLTEALRRESNQAICHHWGITPQTVTIWKTALGIGITEGTSTIRRKHFLEPWAKKMRKKAVAKNSDPERCRKIAESKRGKKRPKHVIEAMARGRQAKGVTEEARQKMRDAWKRRKESQAE